MRESKFHLLSHRVRLARRETDFEARRQMRFLKVRKTMPAPAFVYPSAGSGIGQSLFQIIPLASPIIIGTNRPFSIRTNTHNNSNIKNEKLLFLRFFRINDFTNTENSICAKIFVTSPSPMRISEETSSRKAKYIFLTETRR